MLVITIFVPNFTLFRPRWLLGKWVKYNKNFIYLFISFYELPFWGFVNIDHHFGVKYPQKQFLGRE